MSRSYVVLSEADQKKFGCVERLPYEVLDITAREQATLQKAFGYHTLEDIGDAFMAMLDRAADGTVSPDARVRRDPNLFLAVTWIALRQNGHLTARGPDAMAAELADLDVELARTWFDADPEPEGKDEDSTPTRT